MNMKINSVRHITAGSTPEKVDIGFAPFLIANEGDSVLYFHEAALGEATSETGFPLKPGEHTPFPMTAEALSISAGGKAAIMLFE